MRIYQVSTIRRFHVMRLQLHYGAWDAFEWGPAHTQCLSIGFGRGWAEADSLYNYPHRSSCDAL